MPLNRPLAGLLFLAIIGGSPWGGSQARAEDPTKEIRVLDRQPLSLCVYYPQKKGRYVSSTDMLKFVGEAAGTTTDLEPSSLTDAEISECAALTTPVKCFVERIDATKRGRPASSSGEEGRVKPRDLLLLVAARPTDEGDDELVSAALIDVGTAIELVDNMVNRAPDEVEAKIIERALLARPEPAKVSASDDARQFIIRLFEKDFREALEKTGHWSPYGVVDIKSNVGELSITIDDTVQAGVTAPKGITRLKGVRIGRPKLTLGGNDDVLPWEEHVEVRQNAITMVEPTFEPAPNGLIPATNLVTEILGGAMFAVGTGILLYGLAVKPAGTEICFSPTSVCMTAGYWKRFGLETDPSKVLLTASPNGSSFAIAPLGYSMMGTGIVWGLGTWLFGDEEHLPWIQLAAGLVIGVAAYGVSVALDNQSNFDGVPDMGG